MDSNIKLNDIPATLLIPLWARARESNSPSPLIRDSFAVNICERILFDFSVFENLSRFNREGIQLGVAIRTQLFDAAVEEFLAEKPDGLIINIGCGLDARAQRLDNGHRFWLDLDVEETLYYRKVFFNDEPRYKMLAGSLLDPSWLDNIPFDTNTDVLVLSEGTFMYFSDGELTRLFDAMEKKLGSVHVCFEVVGDLMKGKVHASVKALGLNVPFKSGYKSPDDVEKLHPSLLLDNHHSLLDYYTNKWGLMGWVCTLFPSLKNRLMPAIISGSLG